MAYTRVLTRCRRVDRTGVPVTGVRRGAEQLARDPQVGAPFAVAQPLTVGTAVTEAELVDWLAIALPSIVRACDRPD